jgi:hypothetical protein
VIGVATREKKEGGWTARGEATSSEGPLTSIFPKDGAKKPHTSREDIRDAPTENVGVDAQRVNPMRWAPQFVSTLGAPATRPANRL